MNKDIRQSIASLKSQLEKLDDRIDQADIKPDEDSDAFSHHLHAHITYLNMLLQQEGIPHPGTPEFEEWKQQNLESVGSVIPWDKIDSEIQSIVKPLIVRVNNIADEAKKDAGSALKAAKDLESKLEEKLRDALAGLLSDIENVETIVSSATLNMLQIAGNVPGSIDAKKMDSIFNDAENFLHKKFMEELQGKESASPLHRLLELLQLVHTLAELGQDLVERVEIVIHSVKDLGEDTQQPLVKLLEAVKDLLEAIKEKNKKEILEKYVELLVAIIVTINPIAAAIEALFVGEKQSLRQLLMPGIPRSGAMYQWMTEVSDRKSLKDKRIQRERAFRRMVVGAVDSYIRTGHTGKKVINGTSPRINSKFGDFEFGGTIRPVDLRPLVASGVELANVLCGALFSYLFIPSGIPNPSVAKLPHLSVSKPHPFDFRADMAASLARTVTQPVMSIAAVVLNGFWEISPNNRALVNAVSGYVGNLVRSLFEHLVSGILHMVEVHEVYPDLQQAKRGYVKVTAWDSWNVTPDSSEKLKFGVYLDVNVAFHFMDENIDKDDEQAVQQALERMAEKLGKLIDGLEEDDKAIKEEDSILLGLLKDYVAYREAVMDYRVQRADSEGAEVKNFSVTRGSAKDEVQFEVTLDEKSINGPTLPVVRVVGGDLAPVILLPVSNNTYTGEMGIPPLSKFTNQLEVHATSNYGGMKIAKVSDF